MLETILESTSIKKYQHLRSERFEHVIYIYIILSFWAPRASEVK